MSLFSKSAMPPKFQRLSFFKSKGTVFGVVAALFGGGYYVAERTSAVDSFKQLMNITQSQTEEGPSYILLPPDKKGIFPYGAKEEEEKSWIALKFEKKKRQLHWKLLKLARSKDRNVRHMAVKALTEIPNLDDSEYLEIAQACDLRTAVGLARTLGADPRFFLPPPHQHSDPVNLETEFRVLLASLPQSDVSECVQYFTQNAIQSGYSSNFVDNGGEWCFGGEGLAGESIEHQRPRKAPPESVEKFCLQALLSHSTIPSHRMMMVEKGGLQLLHKVIASRKENLSIQSLVCQIIANLALEEKLHKSLFMSGWLGILASWVNCSEVQLSIPANKALANIDRDYASEVLFEDGVYPLYPQFRGRERKIRADVVFVHGLLGGTFKTWRQHDSKKPSQENSSKQSGSDTKGKEGLDTVEEDHHNFHATLGVVQGIHPDGYTHCWPKDWLAYECPHLRLVSVDYDTYVSEWGAKCPVEKNKHTLQERGAETLQKLIAAGVGERPIIWVAHSMGGLLVKQMLVEAKKSSDPRVRAMAEKTSGIVFYSVPHRGVSMANMRPSVEIILQPSIEVQQLRQDSPQLLKLHEQFKSFVEKQNVAVLSFAETLKSKVGLRWTSLLVPPDSADPGLGELHHLPADHLNTCKPETHDSLAYRLSVDFMLKHASNSLIGDLVGPTPTAEEMETSVVIGLVQ